MHLILKDNIISYKKKTLFEKLLLRIQHHINKLICVPQSIERILLMNDYSQLDSLSLINFPKETFYQYLTVR